jgi:hypothetical protein
VPGRARETLAPGRRAGATLVWLTRTLARRGCRPAMPRAVTTRPTGRRRRSPSTPSVATRGALLALLSKRPYSGAGAEATAARVPPAIAVDLGVGLRAAGSGSWENRPVQRATIDDPGQAMARVAVARQRRPRRGRDACARRDPPRRRRERTPRSSPSSATSCASVRSAGSASDAQLARRRPFSRPARRERATEWPRRFSDAEISTAFELVAQGKRCARRRRGSARRIRRSCDGS